MSDIGFYGVGAFLVALAMLAVAGVGLLIEALLVWRRRSHPTPARFVLLGPLVYALVALGMMVLVEGSSLDGKKAWDDVSLVLAAGALVPWIGLHVHRRRQMRAQRTTSPRLVDQPVHPGR